jgi:hypothetical protein
MSPVPHSSHVQFLCYPLKPLTFSLSYPRAETRFVLFAGTRLARDIIKPDIISDKSLEKKLGVLRRLRIKLNVLVKHILEKDRS